jgi:hypothetical protein
MLIVQIFAQEASVIRQTVLLADTLPEDTRTTVRAAFHRVGRLAGNGTRSRELAADTSRAHRCDEGAIVFRSRRAWPTSRLAW